MGQNVFPAGRFRRRIAAIARCTALASAPAVQTFCLAVPRLPSVHAVILLSLDLPLLSPSAPVNSRPQESSFPALYSTASPRNREPI